MTKIKRRSFLKSSSLLSLPIFAGGFPVQLFPNSPMSSMLNGDDDRVLVIIQLNGGNDGLATIIPRDQQDNLAEVRPNIFIPENEFIGLTDTVALHPSMSGIKEVYDNAQLNIIQGVSYPNQNRSHFRSQDIWNTGSAADEYLDTGWIGRYLDSTITGYPENFPNSDCPDPFALTIGSSASETCEGEGGNYSMVIVDPEEIGTLPTPINNDLAEGCYASNLDFLIESIEKSNDYGEVISAAYENGNNLSTKYNDDSALANKLKTVARLISGGLQTKIYVVELGGFDTHADQVEAGEPTVGNHAELLRTLSDAICAFQNDIQQLGFEKRVLGMTYSEFGRRIRSNFSNGTDHGTAAPLLVFGHCVNPGIIGENVEVSPDVGVNEGVPMQYDFKSVYGSILMDWFKVEEVQISNLFSHDFQYLPIVNLCESVSTKDIQEDQFQLNVYPNPTSDYFNIHFQSENEWIKISLFDSLGSEIKVITNKTISKGNHQLKVETHELPSGPYFIRIQSKLNQKTKRVVKI